jgi:hypothetical protein
MRSCAARDNLKILRTLGLETKKRLNLLKDTGPGRMLVLADVFRSTMPRLGWGASGQAPDNPAAWRKAWALSTRSQVNSGSSRPKWP